MIARVQAIQGYDMGASTVYSELDILEAPDNEEIDIISVDVSGSLEQVEENVLVKIREVLSACSCKWTLQRYEAIRP